MPKQIGLKEFSARLPNLNEDLIKNLRKSWDIMTLDVLEESRDRAPLASGELINSGSRIKAEVTPSGIESRIIYTAPYAKRLDDPNSGLRLKEKGEVSYTIRGNKIRKEKKGELGFLEKSVKEAFGPIRDAIDDSLVKAWRDL